jgi:hypothetical protein
LISGASIRRVDPDIESAMRRHALRKVHLACVIGASVSAAPLCSQTSARTLSFDSAAHSTTMAHLTRHQLSPLAP